MVLVSDVRKAQSFVAIISKKSTYNRKLFNSIVKRCRLAEVSGKPMYIIVEEGVDLGVLEDMPWRKVVHIINKDDVPGILNFIDAEVMGGALYT